MRCYSKPVLGETEFEIFWVRSKFYYGKVQMQLLLTRHNIPIRHVSDSITRMKAMETRRPAERDILNRSDSN